MNARPTIQNVEMTDANTEYSYSLPDGTRRFTIKLRDQGQAFQVAFVDGESGTTYMNVPAGKSYSEVDIKSNATIYFRSTVAAQVAEILSWK